jgi:hypothetical protein
LTLLDEDALLDIFDGLDIPLRRHWSARRFAEQCADDLRAHTAAASGPAGAQALTDDATTSDECLRRR